MKANTIKPSLLLLGLLACSGGQRLMAADHTVTIDNFAFSPSSLKVKVGDKVTWVNHDSIQHTSTSGSNGVRNDIWRSPLLSEGASFSFTFNQAGTFPYFCEPHPFMTGSITAEAAQAAIPTVSITSPSNNTSYPKTTNLTVTATASVTPGSIVSVEFFDGATSLGVDSSNPYEISSTFAAGAHQLTAKATTDAGATATSAAVSITVEAGGEPIANPIPSPIVKTDLAIELQPVATGLISPLGLAAPDDGSQRLFVYDQAGLVYVIENGQKLETPLLDVRDMLVPLRNYDERGLLGLASHPDFKNHPFIYTYTSELSGAMADFMIMPPEGKTNNHQSVLAEWKIDPANPNQIDPSSRREVLRIDEPQSNHNGGTLRFGPDGYLYLTLGDGGNADDQGDGHSEGGNGQDLQKILGKVIRIDVDGRNSMNGQYGIPQDNPFATGVGLDEIYAYGFRNPFSFSFDSLTGELLVADVGQNKVEELDLVFKGGNYGWPIKEGSYYFDPAGADAGFITTIPVRPVPADLVDPIAEYDHDEGLAIVGGYVYHGSKIAALSGRYVTADWGSFSTPTGRLFVKEGTYFKELQIGVDNRPLGLWVKGFGEDQNGELYVFGSTTLGPNGSNGVMLKIVPVDNNISISSISLAENGITVNWQGGIGPFVVESKTTLQDAVWKTETATAERTATIAADEKAAFFRIADAAGNPPISFTISMSGESEKPTATTSQGTGSAILRLEGNTLAFNVSYSGLSGAAGAAHIHGPSSASEFASVMIDLAPYAGAPLGASGDFAGAITLTPAQKAIILSGKSYINVHTASNPSGEIRGQILPAAFAADLSGASERPEPNTASGRATAAFVLAGNELSFNIGYWNLTGTATGAHIHGPAGSEGTASVLIDLSPYNGGGFGATGSIAGRVTLTPKQMEYLADGRLYVNIHTQTRPAGEIRGQILPAVTATPFTASFSGGAERPEPVASDATGSAILLLQGNTLSLSANYAGFQTLAKMAHIHGPAGTANAAGVLVNLGPLHRGEFGTKGVFAGKVSLSDANAALLRSGRTYINIHTEQNGGGEIRGQVEPSAWQIILLGATERAGSVQTEGSGAGQLLLVGNRLYLGLGYENLSAAASAAHIHGPATTAVPAGVMVDLQSLHIGSFGTAGSFAGSKDLTPQQLANLLDGLTYINIHTSTHGSGEIRGQITEH